MKALLTIDEVCAIAGVSKATVYRKVKLGEFPAPTKVPTTSARGPKLVSRWKKVAILDYVSYLRGGHHKARGHDYNAARAYTFARNNVKAHSAANWYESASKHLPDGGTLKAWTDEAYVTALLRRHKHSILAVIGGVLAGLAVWIFK